MNLDIDQPGSPPTVGRGDGAARWFMAAVPIWIVAGFGLPLNKVMQVTFGFVSVTLSVLFTTVLGAGVGAIQCLFLRAVRPHAQRWIFAAVGGALAASVISLFVSFVPGFAFHPGDSPAWLVFQLLLRAACVSGFIGIGQRWLVPDQVRVPLWFVPACVLASCAGSFGVLAVAVSAMRALR